VEPFQTEIDSKKESTRVLSFLLSLGLRSGLRQAVKNNACMVALSDTGKFSRGIARFARAKQKEIVKDTR